MDTSRLFLLGVIHRDEDGPSLLRDWLARIKPDLVTLELSHYGLRFRRELGEEYEKRIERVVSQLRGKGEPLNKDGLASLLSYVKIPYEFDVTSTYAAERGVPFRLIDMDFFSYVKLRAIEELLSEENIEKVLTRTEGQNGNQKTATARLYFEKGIKIVPYDREMYVRDLHMVSKIKDLMKNHPGKRFLHVCGWQHLDDPSNLYGIFNPTKVFSHDKAFCL
jgi:hypothetical protein